MPYPYVRDVTGTDFGSRVYSSTTVAASPSAAAETVICSVTGIDNQLGVSKGVLLFGSAAFTVGTSGASVRLRIRTGTTAGAGTVIFDTGATTAGVAAAALMALDAQGIDASVTGGGAVGSTSYCLTLTVGSAAAASTVSAVNLFALVL